MYVRLRRLLLDPINKLGAKDWSRDIYLMHHFSQHTASTLMHKPEVTRLFREQIPEEAIKYPSLMQGLLALAALHIAALRGPSESRTWVPIAFKHHDRALAWLRKSLLNINEDNCHAMFALSALVFIISLSRSGFPSEPLSPEDLIEPLLIIQGTQKIHEAAPLSLLSGMMAPAVSGSISHPTPAAHVSLPSTIVIQLAYVRTLLSANYYGRVADTLLETLLLVEQTYIDVVFTGGTANGDPGLVWSKCDTNS